jgi:hypothetical protein
VNSGENSAKSAVTSSLSIFVDIDYKGFLRPGATHFHHSSRQVSLSCIFKRLAISGGNGKLTVRRFPRTGLIAAWLAIEQLFLYGNAGAFAMSKHT